jgi:hypothetical protein
MQVSVLNAVVFSAFIVGWAAVATYCLLGARRRNRRHSEWVKVAAGLTRLDGELDRMWAAETRRDRRCR